MAELFNFAFEPKLIYVYRINDSAHEGILKIGEASCPAAGMQYFALEPNTKLLNEAAKERIRHQTQTAGVSFELLYTEITAYQKGKNLVAFQDHEVHAILERSGIKHKYFYTDSSGHKANEWFYTDLETVKKAISAAKEGRTSLTAGEITKDKSPIVFRPEQRDAIDRTIKQFTKKNSSHQMLWNAKMRFGKTITALELIKELDIRRTLILTHRPVVDKGWFEDYEKIFYDRPEFLYGSKSHGSSLEECEKVYAQVGTGSYIYFASIQDMRGSEAVGGKFEKNEKIFEIDWDLIIIDEAHEGTQTVLGKNVLSACKKEHTRVLHLSGTPFNLMEDFKEDEIYTWDYVMEQRAKSDWDKIHQGDPNPYAILPRLNIYTYNLGKLYPDYADEDIAFNFREFFRVDESGNFAHEANVKQFLDLMSKEDEKSNYPFSKKEFRENFRHSLWMVPGVKEAKALSALLQKHPVFSQFNIANVAGDGDEEVDSKDALTLVEKAIGQHPEETYSITLSCGRLTTGVSVKPWTACFMLSGSYNTAASTYMQTIFRVQTPANIAGKQKEECFVFDFAPDRTLKVIAETAKISAKAGQTTQSDRQILGEFLNFCPIIGFEGSAMKAYDTEKMLGELKKSYIERVVKNGFEDGYLYNNELLKLNKVELEEFANLKKIIGSTKALGKTGDINLNAQGLTDEEYEKSKNPQKENRELTEEEKTRKKELEEAKKNRASAISILRGISIRMPLLIYGAELKKNSDGTEDAITLENFTQIIDDLSWKEFMPNGVSKELFSKFKKYYDEDVFRESGVKIREMAKAADKLGIEERISRIAMIFNTFRNPDKETVLTPWRVVNMHLGDCLGGWRFYDKDFREMKEAPDFIEQKEVTKKVFKKDAHILEINSKSGLYALYMAYSIYRTRAKLELGPAPTREMQKSLWNQVLDENIFVLCKTPMAKSITRRTLAGFSGAKVNAHYFEDLVNQLKNKSENFISKVSSKNYWGKGDGKSKVSFPNEQMSFPCSTRESSNKADCRVKPDNDKNSSNNDKNTNKDDKMEFDAIVGNPPYNVNDGGGGQGASASPIYNNFIETSIKLKPLFVSMICPSKWFFGGKGLDNFREHMLSDERLCYIHDFLDATDCFPSVAIAGGVCYFLWDRNHKGDCFITSTIDGKTTSSTRPLREKDCDVFIRYTEGISILRSVRSRDEKSFSDLVSIRNPYCFATNFRGKKSGEIKCYDSESFGFVEEKDIKGDKSLLNNYKVFVSYANGNAIKKIPYSVISVPFVGKPKEICTDTYLQIGPFKNLDETNHVCSYMKTKFFRFLLCLKKGSPVASKSVYQFVPLQDFTSSSDIDWAKSIPEIDKQLYAKYNLSPDEVAFIEKMIKPME